MNYIRRRRNTIFMGGKFELAPGKAADFSAFVFDSEQHSVLKYQFDWSIEGGIFVGKQQGELALPKQILAPKEELLKSLMHDTQNISDSLNDYFVFPKFSVEALPPKLMLIPFPIKIDLFAGFFIQCSPSHQWILLEIP